MLAIGLLAGCGGVEADMGQDTGPAEDTTQLRACSYDYLYEYYSSSSYTQLVGTERCECGRFPLQEGTSSAYRKIVFRQACFAAE
jgi:hypothetical protein